MRSYIDKWLKIAQNKVLPPYCLLCHERTPHGVGLCRPCRAELPWLGRACAHCALPLPDAARSPVCVVCRSRPRFDAALAACHYDSTIRWLVTGLKFRAQLSHADVLADLMAERYAAHDRSRPDHLVPVPLHATSFRRRGFNQAERIAARLAARIGVPIARSAIERTRATARQSELRAAARAANVRGAFVARRDLADTHVAIVDDVVTTTRTAVAVADVLRRAGARRVDCYCVARA